MEAGGLQISLNKIVAIAKSIGSAIDWSVGSVSCTWRPCKAKIHTSALLIANKTYQHWDVVVATPLRLL